MARYSRSHDRRPRYVRPVRCVTTRQGEFGDDLFAHWEISLGEQLLDLLMRVHSRTEH
jgi:hypothetical protein